MLMCGIKIPYMQYGEEIVTVDINQEIRGELSVEEEYQGNLIIEDNIIGYLEEV